MNKRLEWRHPTKQSDLTVCASAKTQSTTIMIVNSLLIRSCHAGFRVGRLNLRRWNQSHNMEQSADQKEAMNSNLISWPPTQKKIHFRLGQSRGRHETDIDQCEYRGLRSHSIPHTASHKRGPSSKKRDTIHLLATSYDRCVRQIKCNETAVVWVTRSMKIWWRGETWDQWRVQHRPLGCDGTR